MAAKKAAKKSAKPVTEKQTSNLLFGSFRDASKLGRLFNALKDEGPHTPESLAKASLDKAEISKFGLDVCVKNINGWKFADLQRIGRDTKAFELAKLEDGKIQLTLKAVGKKAIAA